MEGARSARSARVEGVGKLKEMKLKEPKPSEEARSSDVGREESGRTNSDSVNPQPQRWTISYRCFMD